MASPPDQVLRAQGGFLSPEIRKVDYSGRPAIVKDYSRKHWFVRSVLGPILAGREYRILKRLQGIPGIPILLARIGDRALMTAYIEGKPIHKYPPGSLPAHVFERLTRLVDLMHARRVAHLDLRQKRNIFVTPEGNPYLMDFANAVYVPRRSVFSGIFFLLERVDYSALLKFKRRNFPQLLDERDKQAIRKFNVFRRMWIFRRFKMRDRDRL